MEYEPAPSSDPQHFMSFGASTANVPFLFNMPLIPESPKADINDVHMNDPSPHKGEDSELQRPLALGAVRRVHRRREKALAKPYRPFQGANDHENDGSSSDEDAHASPVRKISQPWTTSNHYTLNMQSPTPPPTNLPFLLLGFVSQPMQESS